ncbi:AsmA family protein, partial [Methylobacterium indicum]
MRDILTALAGLVILILAAALVAPPFIPWEAYRGSLDAALSRSLGLEVRSDGRLEIRLLPSPRLRVDHLRLTGGRDRPSLDARFVKAEIALTPLLSGEIRFTETRIGRGEVTLPTTEAGGLLALPDFAGEGHDLAVEDLRVAQLLVTTRVAATGRTDQVYAETVRLSAPRLTGPWRAEGSVEGVPFRVTTGEPGPDGAVPVKLGAGGDTVPRLDLDARVTLLPGPDGGRVPEAAGNARLVVGPPAQAAGAALPFSVQGGFKAKGRLATFETLTLEVPGEAPLRFTGRGSLDLAGARAALSLEARRLDLDGFLMSAAGQSLLGRGLSPGALPGTLSLDVAVDSLTLAREEWTGAALSAVLRPSGAVALRRLAGTAAGGLGLALSGDVTPSGGLSGHVALDAPASDRLARLLDRLGLGGPLAGLLDGRPFSAEADVAAALPVLSLRNARVALGSARITGSARYSPAGPDQPRPRFDAQIIADGLDVAELPPMRGAVAALHDHDVGLTLLARDLRYGPAGPRTGEIAASLQSEGAAIRLDSLEVRDLAGARASLSGRIGADGAGRIAGQVSAPVAAPLVDLLAHTFVDEARLVPGFLRDGPVALDVTLEREPGTDQDRLRGQARGTAAGGRLALSLAAHAGRLDDLDLRLDGVPSGRWLGRASDPALVSPASVHMAGRRDGAQGPLRLTLDGEIAGATIGTARALVLPAVGGPPQDGALTVASADLRPLAGLLGRAVPPREPVPAKVTLGLSRTGETPRLAVTGTVGGSAVDATLTRNAGGDVAGTVAVETLALPWLAEALVLNGGTAPAGQDASSTGWSSARFGPAPAPPATGHVAMTVRRLDLGRGLASDWARFDLGFGSDGLSIRDFTGGLAGGRLTGSATLARQG